MYAPLSRTLLCVAVIAVTAMAQADDRAADTQDEPWLTPDPAAMQRWQDMRFGMFIHWGPVSLTGHEIGWSRGRETPIESTTRCTRSLTRSSSTRTRGSRWRRRPE